MTVPLSPSVAVWQQIILIIVSMNWILYLLEWGSHLSLDSESVRLFKGGAH